MEIHFTANKRDLKSWHRTSTLPPCLQRKNNLFTPRSSLCAGLFLLPSAASSQNDAVFWAHRLATGLKYKALVPYKARWSRRKSVQNKRITEKKGMPAWKKTASGLDVKRCMVIKQTWRWTAFRSCFLRPLKSNGANQAKAEPVLFHVGGFQGCCRVLRTDDPQLCSFLQLTLITPSRRFQSLNEWKTK